VRAAGVLQKVLDALPASLQGPRGFVVYDRTPSVVRMQRSGPGARCVGFEGCGHVPSLMRMDQIDAVTTFLEAA
jgi:hypothetical protein